MLSRVTFCWRRLVLSHRAMAVVQQHRFRGRAELHQGAKSLTLPKSDIGKCNCLCWAAWWEGSTEAGTLRRMRSGRTTEEGKHLGSRCWCEWGIVSISVSQARSGTARKTDWIFVVATKVTTCNCWVNSRMTDQRIEKKIWFYKTLKTTMLPNDSFRETARTNFGSSRITS